MNRSTVVHHLLLSGMVASILSLHPLLSGELLQQPEPIPPAPIPAPTPKPLPPAPHPAPSPKPIPPAPPGRIVLP